MVTNSATTRVRHAATDDSDALPGGELPSIPAHLHSRILSELCDPASSLLSVARNFRISVDILALWLGEPEVREKMLRIEKGGYAHTRMAASVTLASTVNVLHTIIEDFTQVRAHARSLREHERLPAASSRHDPLPHSNYHQYSKRAFLPGEALLAQDSFTAQRLELRRADCVRRAAHHLYRLSRIVPVDDSKLALAAAHRTASVSERTAPSDSQLPRQPVPWGAAGALPNLPLASSLNDDANSVACLHEVQACSEERTPSPSPDQPHSCAVGGAAMPPDAHAPSSDKLSSSSSSSPISPCHSVALRGESSSSQSCSSRSSPCLGALYVSIKQTAPTAHRGCRGSSGRSAAGRVIRL